MCKTSLPATQIKYKFSQKRVSVFYRGLPVSASTLFQSSKCPTPPPVCLRMCSNIKESARVLILPSPSSWVLVQLAEGEAAGAPQPPSSRLPPALTVLSLLPSLKTWLYLWSFSVSRSTLRCSAGGLIWPSEVEVECSSSGISNSYTFGCSLSFLFCQKQGASDDKRRLRRTLSPTRPLSPKTNGPFSEHFPVNRISPSNVFLFR